jgi:putative Mg2+ transporter-C (MgtC) family protein
MIENEMIVRLVVAAVLGALVGLERSIAGKHAGMRTYALVSLGSCLFIVVGTLASYQLAAFASLNPLIIASNVVLGIGFLGAGLNAFRKEHPELTTAAGLWVVAGIGMAAGFGFYSLAVGSGLAVVLIFSLFLPVESAIRRRYGTEADS